MTRSGNAPSTSKGCSKQQGSSPLPFLNRDFKAYNTTEWYQWELNIEMSAKGAAQLNAANDIGTKVKALLIKLLAVH
eukprot:12866653-Ditylum_brightwellii.AAC.1